MKIDITESDKKYFKKTAIKMKIQFFMLMFLLYWADMTAALPVLLSNKKIYLFKPSWMSMNQLLFLIYIYRYRFTIRSINDDGDVNYHSDTTAV